MSGVIGKGDLDWLYARYYPDFMTPVERSTAVGLVPQQWKVAIDASGWGPSVIEQAAPLLVASDVPFELACQRVMSLGYLPSECLIETRLGNDAFSRHDILKVRGESVFEVVTTSTMTGDPSSELTINLTIAPRWLTMPPHADVRTEPNQSRRHLPGSGGRPSE